MQVSDQGNLMRMLSVSTPDVGVHLLPNKSFIQNGQRKLEVNHVAFLAALDEVFQFL